MDKEVLSDLVQNESLDDEVLYLKPGVEFEDIFDDSNTPDNKDDENEHDTESYDENIEDLKLKEEDEDMEIDNKDNSNSTSDDSKMNSESESTGIEFLDRLRKLERELASNKDSVEYQEFFEKFKQLEEEFRSKKLSRTNRDTTEINGSKLEETTDLTEQNESEEQDNITELNEFKRDFGFNEFDNEMELGEYEDSDIDDIMARDAPFDNEMNDMNLELLNNEYISWSKKLKDEPCCLSVHPGFPEIAHVSVGNCGDSCVIYDFDTRNRYSNEGELLTLGPYEETVSVCLYSNCGNYLALGCLDGNIFLYFIEFNNYRLLRKIEKMLVSVEWLSFSDDSNLLVSSGEGGILVVYQVKNDIVQVFNINSNSSIGTIMTYSIDNIVSSSGADKPDRKPMSIFEKAGQYLLGNNNNNYSNNGDDNRNKDNNNNTNKKRGINTINEYNIICGCKDNTLIILKLNHYFKQLSLNKVYYNTNINNTFNVNNINDYYNIKNKDNKDNDDNIISLSVHKRLKLCGYGTLNGNVVFVNLNKKNIFKLYSNIHNDSVESVYFTNNNINNSNRDNRLDSNSSQDNNYGNIQNELIISIGLDGLIVFYDVLKDCNKLNTINLGYGLTKMAIHPKNNMYIIGSVTGVLVIINTQRVIKEIKCHTKPILDVQVLNLGQDCYTITISEDKTLVM